MELTRTSWFGGWCEGAGEGARTHARTQTRAPHRHARAPGGAGAHAERAGDPRGCSPPLGTALAGWGRGREAVTGATSAAVAFPECRGSSSAAGRCRAELRAAGSAATGRGVCAATLSPGRLGGGGGPRWVGTRGTGRRCEEAAPGAHVCPAPRGGAGGTARGPGHALLPARPRGRPRPGVAARGPSPGLESSWAHQSVSAGGLATPTRNTSSAHRPT